MSETRKRLIGLDVGLRRIGIALSDELGITAQGLPTLQRRNLRADLAILSQLAAEHHAAGFVVGNPLQLSGREGRQAGIVHNFAEQLRERSKLPVFLWDERFTTVEANRVLRAGGASIEKRARAVDRLSAVLILQSYLDAQSAWLPSPEDEGEWPADDAV